MVLDFILLSYLSTHTWLIFFISFVLADLVTAIHILKNKNQEPVSALLWIFIIIDFHIMGIVAYLILGINRLNTKGIKAGIVQKNMDKLRHWENSFSNFLKAARKFNYTNTKFGYLDYQCILDRLQPDTFPLGGNEVNLLVDGTTAYPKMLEAIRGAQDHIHLQSYIIMDDAIGNEIFQALEERAKKGVRVKVLFDRMGSGNAYKSHFFKYWGKKYPNLQVLPFSKFNLLTPWRIQLRNHRKLLICDGKKAFVGGINISADNDRRLEKKNYIHDLHFEIKGPALGKFQYVFLRDWAYVTNKSPLKLLEQGNFFPHPEKCSNSIIRVNSSGPGQAYEGSKNLFMTAITAAKDYLWIITPYFVPDNSFISALEMAAARNVDVKIIIPQNNNLWYIRYASRSYYDALLNYNIKIYEKRGNFSHSKTMLIDGNWAIIGSSNCDIRSFRLNYELDCAVEGNKFITELHAQFIKELRESQPIKYTERLTRSFKEEIIENFCSLFKPIM